MQRAPQFVTEEFSSHAKFLPDEEYGRALDTFVKACSDTLVTNADGKILLGKRNVEPQPDWWFIGGRAKPGEGTCEAAARNVKRELGVSLPSERFKVIGNYSFVWGKRQQEPQSNGTADISTIHTVRLSPKEADAVTLDEKEYASSAWVDPTDVLQSGSKYKYHPALRQAVCDLLTFRKWSELGRLVNGGASSGSDENKQVADCARELVALHKAAEDSGGSGIELTEVRFDSEQEKYRYIRGKPIEPPQLAAPAGSVASTSTGVSESTAAAGGFFSKLVGNATGSSRGAGSGQAASSQVPAEIAALVGTPVFSANSLEAKQGGASEFFGIIEAVNFDSSSASWALKVRWNFPEVSDMNRKVLEQITPKDSSFEGVNVVGVYPIDQVALWAMWAGHRELGRKIGAVFMGTVSISLLFLGGNFALRYWQK